MFFMIVGLIIVLQIIIVSIGNRPMACSKHGLSLVQWLICFFVASFGLLINVIAKLVKFEPKGVGNKEMTV